MYNSWKIMAVVGGVFLAGCVGADAGDDDVDVNDGAAEASDELLFCPPGTGVKGNGVQGLENRTVANFTSVKADTGVDITVKDGAVKSVQVSGDSNLLPLIKTTVVSGKLTVAWLDCHQAVLPIKIVVTAPTLSSVAAFSGSKVTVSGVLETAFTVDSRDGSSVTASGQADTLTVSSQDGSSVKAQGLVSQNVNISSGDGVTAIVYASLSVSGSIGVGTDLSVYGNPATRSVSKLTGSTITYK